MLIKYQGIVMASNILLTMKPLNSKRRFWIATYISGTLFRIFKNGMIDQMHHFKAAEFLGLNLIKGFDDLSSKYSKQYVIIAEVTSVDCLNFDRT